MTVSSTPVAVGYIRVSTEMQAEEDRMSLPQQAIEIESYCEKQGYQLAKIYRDAGYSGTTFHRPAFKEMLSEVETLGVNVIVCWRADRLYRASRVVQHLKDALEGTGVRLESITDHIDPNMMEVIAAINGMEVGATSERTRMGLRGRANKGKTHGVILFGYRQEDGKPVVDPEESELVKRIFDLYNSGISLKRIANLLNDEGITTRKGGKWWPTSVYNIVSNETYTGKGQFGKRRIIKKVGRDKDQKILRWQPEENWIEIPYPAIVDDEIYNRATDRRQNQQRKPTGTINELEYPLKGILWCAEHNKPYTTSYVSDHGKIWRYYRCSSGTRHADMYGRCSQPSLSAAKVEDNIWKRLYEFLLIPERRNQVIQELKDSVGKNAIQAVSTHQKRLDGIQDECERLLVLFQKGYIQTEELDNKMLELRKEEKQRQNELQILQNENAEIVSMISFFDFMQEIESEDILLKGLYAGEEDQVSRTQLFSFLKRVNVTTEGFEPTMRFPVPEEFASTSKSKLRCVQQHYLAITLLAA